MEFKKKIYRNLTNLAGAGLSGSQDLVTKDTVSLAPEKNQRRKKYWNSKTSINKTVITLSHIGCHLNDN